MADYNIAGLMQRYIADLTVTGIQYEEKILSIQIIHAHVY